MADRQINFKALRLEIKNVRGIRDANLLLEGQNLVLVGENGAGKSSFVDALEYLFTGSLERLCRQDVKERQSFPFVGRCGTEVTVALTCQIDGATCVFQTGYPYAEPQLPEPQFTKVSRSWWQQVRARPPILRRTQIVKIIEDKGADRYRQISTLIGLDEVDAVLKAWRELRAEWQRQVQSHQAALARQQLKAENLGLLRDGELTLDTVNQRLQAVGLAPVAGITEVNDRLATLKQPDAEGKAAQQAAELSRQRALLQTVIDQASRLDHAYRSFYETWDDFRRVCETLKEALFHDLWERSSELLAAHAELEVCPVCQQPIDREQLLAALRSRLESLAAVQQKSREVQNRREEVAGALSELLTSVGQLRPAVLMAMRSWPQELMAFRSLLRGSAADSVPPLPPALSGPGPVLQAEIQRLDREVQQLQPSTAHQLRMDTAIYLQNLLEVWPEIVETRLQLAQAQRAVQYLDTMERALLQAREQRLSTIHTGIAATINDYFRRLHPQEGYGQIGLPLERGGKSVGLRADFHLVNSTHPVGFYSEGHLDSLGIAIFLAYVKQFNGNAGLLVLDDVMTTIDKSHRQRLAILLAEEFADFQLLLTTYDRLWAEELVTTMKAGGLKVKALHLLPWDIQTGVTWQELLEHRWDEYYQHAGTDPLSAVANTGRDFEKFLGIMRQNLQLSIPARPEDRYTIGDLYPSFFAWFEKRKIQHPTRDFKAELEALRRELDFYWRYRNWAGAHYNVWGADLSPAEARDFIALVKKLVELLSCPRCSSPVAYNEKSGVLFCERCKDKSDGASWRVVRS